MEGAFVLHNGEVPDIEEEIRKIIELADVGRGWTYVNSVENVNCYVQKSDRSSIDYVLGEGIIHTTPEALLHFLQNPTTTEEIDPALIERDEITKLSETSRIMRLRYKFPAPLSNREFVVHSYDGVVDGLVVCAGISVSHEMCPEDPQYVRGIILTSGYVCKEITQSPPRTHVSYVIQFDPKGWIPAVVVNLIAAEQARNITRLKKYFERALSTEQTYKFSPQLNKTVDSSQSAEWTDGGETTGTDSSAPPQAVWHEQDLGGSERSPAAKIMTLLDIEQDTEAQETLIDTSTAPLTASRLLQKVFSSSSS